MRILDKDSKNNLRLDMVYGNRHKKIDINKCTRKLWLIKRWGSTRCAGVY
jgi:hypothetical protein